MNIVLIIPLVVLFVHVCLSAKLGEKCTIRNSRRKCEENLKCHPYTGTCLRENIPAGEPCINKWECDQEEFLVCDTRLNRTHVCAEEETVYGQTCEKNDDCVPSEEICNTAFKKCHMSYHQLCNSNSDCEKRYECKFDASVIYNRCIPMFEFCTRDKCPAPHEICVNDNGIAKCKCSHPYKGTPPDCNLNCVSDSDCYSDYECRSGQCTGACEGKCGPYAVTGKICVINSGKAKCIRPSLG